MGARVLDGRLAKGLELLLGALDGLPHVPVRRVYVLRRLDRLVREHEHHGRHGRVGAPSELLEGAVHHRHLRARLVHLGGQAAHLRYCRGNVGAHLAERLGVAYGLEPLPRLGDLGVQGALALCDLLQLVVQALGVLGGLGEGALLLEDGEALARLLQLHVEGGVLLYRPLHLHG